jgi:hypothetical protein
VFQLKRTEYRHGCEDAEACAKPRHRSGWACRLHPARPTLQAANRRRVGLPGAERRRGAHNPDT